MRPALFKTKVNLMEIFRLIFFKNVPVLLDVSCYFIIKYYVNN